MQRIALIALATFVLGCSGKEGGDTSSPADDTGDAVPADDTGPDDTGPAADDTAPDDTGPDDTAPDDTGPGETGDDTGPDDSGPDDSGTGDTGEPFDPDDFVPDEGPWWFEGEPVELENDCPNISASAEDKDYDFDLAVVSGGFSITSVDDVYGEIVCELSGADFVCDTINADTEIPHVDLTIFIESASTGAFTAAGALDLVTTEGFTCVGDDCAPSGFAPYCEMVVSRSARSSDPD